MSVTQHAWDFCKGPDRSLIMVGEVVQHDRNLPNSDYPPARTVVVPPPKSSGRSTVYYRDPTDSRYKVAEGEFEWSAVSRYIADRRVTRIEPQFGPVWYTATHGVRTHTVFDARIHMDDATKTVMSAKPAMKAEKYGTDALNKLVFSQMSDDAADRVALVTERDLPQWALANYRHIQSVRNDGSWLCESEMRLAAESLTEAKSIEEFCAPWGGAKAVLRTAIYLLFRRVIKEIHPCEFDERTMVIRAGAPK